MNHAVWRSSQQPWNTYLHPNGLWKSPINLTLSWVFLEQRSLDIARQVPARGWGKLWRVLVTNQICKLGLCSSVKDTDQARWLASTNRIDCWGFSVFFFQGWKTKAVVLQPAAVKATFWEQEVCVICPLISAVHLSLDYVHVKVF